MDADISRSYSPDRAYDLVPTLSMMALGRGEPCLRIDANDRVRLSLLGPTGAMALELRQDANAIHVAASGPDAEWLDAYLPSLIGLDYEVPEFAEPRQLRRLARRFAGFRLIRLPRIVPRLVQIVLQQLVSYQDACHGWRELVRRHGTALPYDDDLMAPPGAHVLAKLAPDDYLKCGILPQHSRRIIGLARRAKRIEATWDGGRQPDAIERTCSVLSCLPGIGPWTLGYLRGAAMRDSDATVLGDYNFANQVAYFFSGEERATDDDMLAILSPYRPHRFYLLMLILKGSPRLPRRGPRRELLRDHLRRVGQ